MNFLHHATRFARSWKRPQADQGTRWRRAILAVEELEARELLAATVTGLAPTFGPSGALLTITGTDLDGATAVNFGATPVTNIISNTATSLQVAVPSLSPGLYDVTVVTAAHGTSAASTASQFLADPIQITFTNNTNLGTTPIYVAVFGQLAFNGSTLENTPLTATGTAAMSGNVGQVGSLVLTSAGTGSYAPVTFSAPPNAGGTTAEGTVNILNGQVTGINITNVGSGYNTPLTFTDPGGGTGAAGYATVNSSGQVTGVTMTNAGSNYTSQTTVAFGGGGTGATATVAPQDFGGTIPAAAVTITNGGSGYFTAPTITIGGGGTGVQLTVTSNPQNGAITGVTVQDGGSNYGSIVSFSGGGGSGASATANFTGGAIASLNLISGGSGYTSAPNITFSGGSGTGAAATAVGAATVAGVAITNPGLTYTSAPTVTFSGGGAYGVQATGSVNLAGGSVASVTVNPPPPAPDARYFSAPTVTFSSPATPTTLKDVAFNTSGQYTFTQDLFNTGTTTVPAYQLNFSNNQATITLPNLFMNAVRVLIGVNAPPIATIDSTGAVAAPAMTNANDPNVGRVFDFFEFTLNEQNQLYINTSQVDQVGIPFTMTVNPADPGVPGGTGIAVSRADLFGSGPLSFSSYLTSMGTNGTTSASQAFSVLATDQGSAAINGAAYPLRLIAPADLLEQHASNAPLLNTYFDAELNTLFTTSRTFNLLVPNPNNGKTGNTINPGDPATYTFTGTVSGNQITFTGTVAGSSQSLVVNPTGSLSTPTSAMVFANNGVFADNTTQYPTNPGDTPLNSLNALLGNLLGNIENQLVSALNRGIANLATTGFATDSDAWGGGADPNTHLAYYQAGSTSNFYAGYLHATINGTAISVNNKAYAFAFDDQGGNSTTQVSTNPQQVWITLGAWPPAVATVSPAQGPAAGGYTVNISGSGFTGATAVHFGGIAATSFTVNSNTSIVATSPPGAAGTVHITVTTPGGTSAASAADQYTYVNQTSPAQVIGGNLFVNGSNGHDVIFALPTWNDGVRLLLNGRNLGTFTAIDQVFINGLDGNDFIFAAGVRKALTIDGGNGHDWLVGGLRRDTLIGGQGNDVLVGWRGGDQLLGGPGNNRLIQQSLLPGWGSFWFSFLSWLRSRRPA